MFSLHKSTTMVTAENALPGRAEPIPTASHHFVNNRPLQGPYPEGMQEAMFSMGCFWGVERRLWQVPGIWVTMVGYAGGFTPNPTYKEICSAQTGHTEVVRIIFDPAKLSYDDVLRLFWEGHDPTQGMRQGNDVGPQYRSTIYYYNAEQKAAAERSLPAYQKQLEAAGYGKITTVILAAPEFYFAEDYHQQYLAKNPDGYCGVAGTGVSYSQEVGA